VVAEEELEASDFEPEEDFVEELEAVEFRESAANFALLQLRRAKANTSMESESMASASTCDWYLRRRRRARWPTVQPCGPGALTSPPVASV